jgi:peptidoglycan/LPS O-acetylase OafA/YrhL
MTLRKSSSDSASRSAFAGAAALFGAGTLFVLVLFVRALTHNTFRSGLMTYAIFTGAAAVGMWRRRRWGRGVALVVALGNIGLGTVSLLAGIVDRRSPVLGPVILLVTNVALAYWLGRPVFSFPEERDA